MSIGLEAESLLKRDKFCRSYNLRIIFVLWAVFFSAGAMASETAWVDHDGMLSTRLVMASSDMTTDKGALFAWEAKLAPGWKTYWRSPGEAGLPVRVFVGEDEINPLFPYPERFELFGIQTFGYSHQLLLPFRLKAVPDGQVTAVVDFMVCKDICVPFEHTYVLATAGGDLHSSHDIRFEAWLAKVPSTDKKTINGMEVLSAKVTGRVGHQKLVVDVKADSELSKADLYAEVNDMFYFGVPKIRLLEDGKKARMVLSAMTGTTPEDLRGKAVRLTLSDGRNGAIDRIVKLSN